MSPENKLIMSNHKTNRKKWSKTSKSQKIPKIPKFWLDSPENLTELSTAQNSYKKDNLKFETVKSSTRGTKMPLFNP